MSKQVKSILLVFVALGIAAFIVWHFVIVKQQAHSDTLPGGQLSAVRGN